jgi:hypothetical protein
MTDRPSFRQTIVLIASGGALAFFSCLGVVVTGDLRAPAWVALGWIAAIGFICGAIVMLVNVWRLFRHVPVGQWPRPSNWRPDPPAGDGSTRTGRDEPPPGRRN